jgi:SAM-dependent methyltransferase
MDWVESFFEDPSYDLEYADVLTNTERTAREAAFLARELVLTPASRVLDVACGHGRHAVALAPVVREAVGLDRTSRFLDHARQTARSLGLTNLTFVVCDMRQLEFEAAFDAAYNYFTAWDYYTDGENVDVLARVRRALRPGGRFLLEMVGRDALMRRFAPRDWRRLADGTTVLEERSFDFETGRARSRRTYVGSRGTRTVDLDHQVPAPDHLVAMFREAGFVSPRLLSAPDGGKVGLDSFRVAVLGTRP